MIYDKDVMQLPSFAVSFSFLFTLASILTFFTGWILGFFVLIKALRDKAVRAFAWCSIAFAVWAIFSFFPQITSSPGQARNFSYVALTALSFGMAALVDFCSRIIEEAHPVSHALYRRISYSAAAALSLFTLVDRLRGSGLVIAGIAANRWFVRWPRPGPLLGLYLLFAAACFLFSFETLAHHLRFVRGSTRRQYFCALLSFVCALIAIVSVYAFWYQVPVPPLGMFLLPLFIIGSFYSFNKHHLFNVKIIATEFLIFIVWTFLFSNILLAATRQERVYDAIIFLASFLFGLFIIKSVLNEVKSRELAEHLSEKLNAANSELQDLNENLQEKVDEQTKEIKTAYEVEKKARIELEELDKAKDQFILTTQHHLRTPLTIVKGFLQTVLARKLDKTSMAYLQKASDASERMSKLINEFLSISQMEVGKAIFNFQPQKIRPVLEDIKAELASELEKRGLYCRIELGKEAEEVDAEFDHEAIKQALYNFFDNAAKYTLHGGIAVKGSVIEHPIDKIKMLRLSIKDTGIGMIKEEIANLFNRYFQRSEEAEKINATGKGIGLVLSNNIIKAHHGQVVVESEGRGKGTEFIVLLPIRQPKA